MPKEADSTSDPLLESLEEQRALLEAIRDRQDCLLELMESAASQLNRLDQENKVFRTSLRRMEERFDRRLRDRASSMDKRVAFLESSRR